MTLVREIADAITLLGEVVRNTRELVKAVNDGREYLATRHREAAEDFGELLSQMQLAVEGLAEVTKVVSSFRFEVGDKVAPGEGARFNDYVIAQQGAVTVLRGRIRELKADCEQVRILRDALDNRSKSRAWGSMFGLLGVKSRRQAQDLASKLSNFYADDLRMIESLEQVLRIARRALREVNASLGPEGVSYDFNVERAALILGMYASAFHVRQEELDDLVDELDRAARALTPTRRRRGAGRSN